MCVVLASRVFEKKKTKVGITQTKQTTLGIGRMQRKRK
jgi:hypothetical protein